MEITQVKDTYTNLGRLGREVVPQTDKQTDAPQAEQAGNERPHTSKRRKDSTNQARIWGSDLSLNQAADISTDLTARIMDTAPFLSAFDTHNLRRDVSLITPRYV